MKCEYLPPLTPHKTPAVPPQSPRRRPRLSPVAVPLEVEPELEDPVGKLTAESVAVRVLPLAVDDLERDVLVGGPRVEAQHPEVAVVLGGLQEVLRRGALVDQVGVEDVELVALHDLGRRVVEVVVGLVVLVPLEARVDPVEEARLAGPVLVGPQVHLPRQGHLHAELGLVSAHALPRPAHKRILRALAGIACVSGREKSTPPSHITDPPCAPSAAHYTSGTPSIQRICSYVCMRLSFHIFSITVHMSL